MNWITILLTTIVGTTFNLCLTQGCNYISSDFDSFEINRNVSGNQFTHDCWEISADGDVKVQVKILQFNFTTQGNCKRDPNFYRSTTNYHRSSPSWPDYYRSSTRWPDYYRSSTRWPDYYRSSTRWPDYYRSSTNYYRSSPSWPDYYRSSTRWPDYYRSSTNYYRSSPSWPDYYKSSPRPDYYRSSSRPNYYRSSSRPDYYRSSSRPDYYRSSPRPDYYTSSTRRPDYYRSTPDFYRSSTMSPNELYKVTLRFIEPGSRNNFTVNPNNFNTSWLTLEKGTFLSLEVRNWLDSCVQVKIILKLQSSKDNHTIPGLIRTRNKAITWMKNRLTTPLKWGDDIEKAVIALHLSDGVNFSKNGLIEELLVKQVNLKSSVALLRNKSDPVSLNKLAKIINSQIVTCHNPRNFYGFNLIKMVKEELDKNSTALSPMAYLALCNANESLTDRAAQKLSHALNSHAHSEYPFSSDISALAFLALTCIRNRENGTKNTTDKDYYKAVRDFQQQQQVDGSFGNVYSTALIAQALMSSNNHTLLNSSIIPAMKFLVKHLNASNMEFMAAYYSLPILNNKTLLDIRFTDCSKYNRDRNGNGILDMIDETERKIKVQYSIIIGDKEDFGSTLTLKVADNTTAYEVMQLAQSIEPRYNFEWKRKSGKMYVHEIAGIPVDPEEGRFWLTYIKNDTSAELHQVRAGPDQIHMRNGDHLIQWYKYVHF